MQNTFVNASSHLQLFFVELPDCHIIIKADFKLTDKFTAPMTRL